MGRFGTQEKVGVEVHRGVEPARAVHPDRDARGRFAGGERIHPERLNHVRVLGRIDHAEGDRLERFNVRRVGEVAGMPGDLLRYEAGAEDAMLDADTAET